MSDMFENDMNAFTARVKTLKTLARGNAPSKAPGYYSSDNVVKGRDGNMWKIHRVYHVDTSSDYCDERYTLVWIRNTTV